MIRLSYVAKYPVNEFISFASSTRSVEFRKIKDGIEFIIPRTNIGNDLKTYD